MDSLYSQVKSKPINAIIIIIPGGQALFRIIFIKKEWLLHVIKCQIFKQYNFKTKLQKKVPAYSAQKFLAVIYE